MYSCPSSVLLSTLLMERLTDRSTLGARRARCSAFGFAFTFTIAYKEPRFCNLSLSGTSSREYDVENEREMERDPTGTFSANGEDMDLVIGCVMMTEGWVS